MSGSKSVLLCVDGSESVFCVWMVVSQCFVYGWLLCEW